MISSNDVHGCMNCGCVYHDRSCKNPMHCPVCGHGLSDVQDIEGIHYGFPSFLIIGISTLGNIFRNYE